MFVRINQHIYIATKPLVPNMEKMFDCVNIWLGYMTCKNFPFHYLGRHLS